MKKHFVLFLFFGSLTLFSQSKDTELSVFTFPEVEELQKTTPKPMLVFVHTDWCKYCDAMKKGAFKNKKIIELLNSKFYLVQFNAEDRKNISFLGKTFVFKPRGNNTGTHELAVALAGDRRGIAYPTTVILNKSFEIDLQEKGYLTARQLLKILTSYTR